MNRSSATFERMHKLLTW